MSVTQLGPGKDDPLPLVIGSEPDADPNYHLESDTPESVDLENVVMAVKASLAATLRAGEI